MLTELPEADAKGPIAEIFAEIRRLYATPYVSSIHRHIATRPGVLEWSWETVAPCFRDGSAQMMAWRIAGNSALAPLAPIPRAAMAVWGVAEADLPRLGTIAESFTRVAPLNLVFGGIVRALLTGAHAGGKAAGARSDWQPPASLEPPPAMLDPAHAEATTRALLALFRSGTGATAFVPGLYRMLAHWPGLLAHLAVELLPRFASAEKERTAAALLAGIDAGVADLLQRLPPAALPPPDAAEAQHLVAMIDGYRVTSPEMILFGRLIRDALPPASGSRTA